MFQTAIKVGNGRYIPGGSLKIDTEMRLIRFAKLLANLVWE